MGTHRKDGERILKVSSLDKIKQEREVLSFSRLDLGNEEARCKDFF